MLPQYVLLLVLSAASVEFKCGYYLLFQFFYLLVLGSFSCTAAVSGLLPLSPL